MLTILRKKERKVFIQGGTKRTSEFKTTIITFILIVQYITFIYINTACQLLNFKIKFFFNEFEKIVTFFTTYYIESFSSKF